MFIPLNGLGVGKFAQVDPEDYTYLMMFSWHYRNGYALTNKNGREYRMHRLILREARPEMIVDHINRNRLDNRRSNLRLYTPKQNANNMGTNRHIQAFGEWKTIGDWASDPRCGVSYDTLRARLNKEILPEIAILGDQDEY